MNVYMEEILKEPTDKLLELVNEFSKITCLYVCVCSISMYINTNKKQKLNIER